jgi:YesN/AraC family two-component response regulator
MDDDPKTSINPAQRNIFVDLELRIENWLSQKGFTEKGINIDKLANICITNRNYLSAYINEHKRKNFRDWINELRIEEAKKLMQQDPELKLSDIAEQVGFADNSHFTRQFGKQTGVTPTKWKLSIS